MERTLISFDYAMKNVLRDKANFVVLNGFLSELLKQNIVVQEILESESNKDTEYGKLNRLDLKAKINDGEIVIFEIQAGKEFDFFHRMLFGTSKTIVEHLAKGDDYEKIKKIYSIDIVYFELGKGSDYIYRGRTEFTGLHNKETLMLSSKERKYLPRYIQNQEELSAREIFPEYYIIYPKHFHEEIKDKFDEWVYFLKNSAVKFDFTAAGIKEASEKLAEERMTKADKNDYENFIKARRVKSNEVESAKWEGEQKGKAEGRTERGIEIAKNLKNLGMPTEQISQATGLSIDEIDTL